MPLTINSDWMCGEKNLSNTNNNSDIALANTTQVVRVYKILWFPWFKWHAMCEYRLINFLSLLMQVWGSLIDVFRSSGLRTVLFYENTLFFFIERSGRLTAHLTLMNEVSKACWHITDLDPWFAKGKKNWITYQLEFEGWLSTVLTQSYFETVASQATSYTCSSKKYNSVICSSVVPNL